MKTKSYDLVMDPSFVMGPCHGFGKGAPSQMLQGGFGSQSANFLLPEMLAYSPFGEVSSGSATMMTW
jgi:hypothetical protein